MTQGYAYTGRPRCLRALAIAAGAAVGLVATAGIAVAQLEPLGLPPLGGTGPAQPQSAAPDILVPGAEEDDAGPAQEIIDRVPERVFRALAEFEQRIALLQLELEGERLRNEIAKLRRERLEGELGTGGRGGVVQPGLAQQQLGGFNPVPLAPQQMTGGPNGNQFDPDEADISADQGDDAATADFLGNIDDLPPILPVDQGAQPGGLDPTGLFPGPVPMPQPAFGNAPPGFGGSSGGGGSASMPMMVREVMGVGVNLKATMSLPNGTRVRVTRGALLPTGHTVTEITADFVMVERGGQMTMVGFPGDNVIGGGEFGDEEDVISMTGGGDLVDPVSGMFNQGGTGDLLPPGGLGAATGLAPQQPSGFMPTLQ